MPVPALPPLPPGSNIPSAMPGIHYRDDIALAFDVLGNPGPQGSKRHVGRGIMIESSKFVGPWREDVKLAARAAIDEHEDIARFPLIVPIVLNVTFFLDRPMYHYKGGPNSHMLRDQAPPYPVKKPDVDKLLRSTMDALTTAGVWRDDCLVHIVNARKHWSTYRATWHAPGARIVVSTPV